MLLFPIACGCGMALGRLAGGRLDALAALRFRATPILGIALIAQVSLRAAPDRWRFVVVACSYCFTGLWLVLNTLGRTPWLRVGLGHLLAGYGLNLAAILPNGGMPVSSHALAGSGATTTLDGSLLTLAKHVPADQGTRLSWLGDVIPLSPLHTVMSVGDVVMMVGVAVAVAGAMRHPRPRPACRPEPVAC